MAIKTLTTIISSLCLFLVTSYAFAASPEGYWAIPDTQQTRVIMGVVKISSINGRLVGEFIKFILSNRALERICVGCQDYVKTKPLTGAIFMCNYQLAAQGNWVNGKVYDVKSNNIYDSSLRLSPNGQQLYVTGRSGPFSRTVVWYRLAEQNVRNA